MKKLMFISFLGAFLMILPGPSWAQEASGEIINVNPQLQVAFVNLSKDDLSLGDIVSIYKQLRFLGYLQVVGTSNAVSKLTVVQGDQGRNLEPIDFNKISIGDTVKKESLPAENTGNPQASVSSQQANSAAMEGTTNQENLTGNSQADLGVSDAPQNEENSQENREEARSLDDTRNLQSNALEEDLASTKKKLDDTLLQYNQVAAQNMILQRDNDNMKTEIKNLQQESLNYFQQSIEWRQKYSDLQKRLNYILDLDSKNNKDKSDSAAQ